MMIAAITLRVSVQTEIKIRDCLVTQWIRLCASNAGHGGLIPGQGTKIPHAPVQPK